jgi:D-sedoheptulose 7-phosphate isomerase
MSTGHFKPAWIVLDIDGVLTDGSDSVSAGDKRLFLRDLDALTRARGEGLGVAFLTGESEEAAGPVVERCGGGLAMYGVKNKAEGMRRLVEQMGCSSEEVCYVADGERDAPALELVGLALAPSDASASARAAADRVLAARGGAGAVEEAITLLFPPIGVCGDDPAELVRGELRVAAQVLNTVAEGEIRALGRAVEVMAESLAAGGKVVLFGNGGSSTTAQHAAAELVGRSSRERRPLPAIALTTDTALLTALTDDLGHEEIFERQVEALVRFGDVAVGLSTSGQSVNVARALAAAGRLGARTIALVGAEPGLVGEAADLCVNFPVSDTARIHELHLVALHAACAYVDGRMG